MSVIARYQGNSRVSSLPDSLAVNANGGGARLRMGSRVPVAMTVGPQSAPTTYNYESVGTNIDCTARTADDGRFELMITIEDSSVYPQEVTPQVGGRPSFRSFSSTNTLLLRDGQTRQFTAATDRVNGEVVKVDVTLEIVK